jgi:ATP-dependent 26S proteasome regulatory subunit
MSKFTSNLQDYVNAAYPALFVHTFEEHRIVEEIKTLSRRPEGKDSGCSVYEWDCVQGLTLGDEVNLQKIPNTIDPVGLFTVIKDYAKSKPGEKIFVLKDGNALFTAPLKGPLYVRAFKNVLSDLKAARNSIVIVAANPNLPMEVQKDIQHLDYALPNEEAIASTLQMTLDSANAGIKGKADKLTIAPDIHELSIEAAKGMTANELESAFALAIVKAKTFNNTFVKHVFNEKTQQIKKTNVLDHMEAKDNFDNVGGLEGVKKWVRERKMAFSKQARAYRLPFPKGLGLAGIPGCGKTLISQCIAGEFGVPLYKLDLGGLFSKYVGATEGNFIQMTRVVESIGRCVILIDEIEKYLNNGATSGAGDSGTSSRSFGTLLHWLASRTCPAFIVYTSNNHLALPIELVRPGRFDTLFWVDLPNQAERTDIVNIVIKKFGRDPQHFDIQALVDKTDGFTGSEISQGFQDGLFRSFAEDTEVTTAHVLAEYERIVPSSRTNYTQIEKMRETARGKLRFASDVETLHLTQKSTTRKIKTTA